MRMKELFARDIGRRIEPVVKVNDRRTLLEDLQQFVITGSIETSIDKFLDEFTRSLDLRRRGGKGPDGMAVWLAGFFGSGKSHLAKVLGHVIENDVVDQASGERAMEVFSLHLDDPTLKHGLAIKKALKQVRDHTWCQVIPFDIKSRQDQTNPESVTEICLRSFYAELGLCPTVYVARLERRLQREGHYEAFLATYETLHGRAWTQDRLEHAFYLDELVAALSEVLGKPEDRTLEMVKEYRTHHARVDPEGFAREVLQYLDEVRGDVAQREPHVLFVIDEMGQFIGDSGDKIEELRAIIEQAGSHGSGRIWFIATSQEALDQVVHRTGLKLSQLGKLDARFSVKISLTSEEIKKVVGERLLRKREAEDVRGTLRALYDDHDGYLAELSNLHMERTLAELDQGSFAASYPFLPHMIPLAQELFDAMRGFKLSGSERSLIGVAQGTLGEVADAKPGALVPLDMIFDQASEELTAGDYLGASGMRAIREANAKVTDTPIRASRVLKVLWLIERVQWVPRTPEVIGKLLVERVGEDLGALRSDVEKVLERLREAGYVGRDEANRQYKYLSEKERGLEEAIQTEMSDYGMGVAIRRARELLKTRVLTRTKLAEYRVTHGKQGIFEFGLDLDNETVRTAGEITLSVYSPLSPPDAGDIEQENLGRGTKGRTVWWMAGDVPTLVERLKRAEALDKVPQKPRWAKDTNDETKKVLKDKAKELSGLENSIVSDLERALREGRIYYSGEELDLDGSKDLKGVVSEVMRTVGGHLYSRFPTGDKSSDERNIPKYLQPTTQKLARLDPDLGLFDSQDHLNLHAALVQTIHEELERRQDEDEDLTGKEILDHFSKIPFGWPPALVRLVLAAMFRGGAVILEPHDSDQQLLDFTESGADGYFTGVNRFKKTRFVPTTGGLTPTEVKEATTALVEMEVTGVPESANAIADKLRKKAGELVSVATAAAQKVQDTGLPLPDLYTKAETITSAATHKRDPVALVRQFLEDRDEWKAVWAFLEEYQRFIDEDCDRRWRDASKLVHAARATPTFTQGDEGHAAAAALVDLDAIVAEREIVAKWKVYQERFGVVRDHYRSLYSAAYKAAVDAVTALKEELLDAELFNELEEPRAQAVIEEFFGPGATLHLPPTVELSTTVQLLNATSARTIAELESLRLAVPGHRKAIYERIRAELEQQEGGTGGGDDGGREVFVFDTRSRLAGRRFVSQEAFRDFWNGLGDEVEEKLQAGVEVMIE